MPPARMWTLPKVHVPAGTVHGADRMNSWSVLGPAFSSCSGHGHFVSGGAFASAGVPPATMARATSNVTMTGDAEAFNRCMSTSSANSWIVGRMRTDTLETEGHSRIEALGPEVRRVEAERRLGGAGQRRRHRRGDRGRLRGVDVAVQLLRRAHDVA